MTNEGDPKLQAALDFAARMTRKRQLAGQEVRPIPKPGGKTERVQLPIVLPGLKAVLGDIALSEGETWAAELEYHSLTPAQREQVEEPLTNYPKLDTARAGTVATYRPHEIKAALTEGFVEAGTPLEQAGQLATFAHGFHFHPWKVRRSA